MMRGKVENRLSLQNQMNHTRYLYTQLELMSEEELTPTINGFGEGLYSWYEVKEAGFYRTYLESLNSCAEPNADVELYCHLVETLAQEERMHGRASCIIFNLAYESGDSSVTLSSELRPETIQKIAKWGASIQTIIYPLGFC